MQANITEMIASLEEFKVLLKQRERGRQINEQALRRYF